MKAAVITVAIFGTLLIGCTQDDSSTTKQIRFASKAEADAASPLTLSCERTEQVPISRGRGQGLEGKYETITYYYPGYLRGDVNSDGQITRDDAMIAVRKLFDPNKFDCPATADVAGSPQTLTPDGFFTSQDIYIWNQFKNSGQITWPNEVICAFNCKIINHMQP